MLAVPRYALRQAGEDHPDVQGRLGCTRLVVASQPPSHKNGSLQSGVDISNERDRQNAAARLLTGTRRGDHTSPVLRQLHWLPVQRRVDFKLACFVYSSLSGQAPPYLADDIPVHLVSEGPRRRLRSSTCAVPRTHNTFGDRSFAAAGSRLWNSLPVHLRDEDISYNSFQRELKTVWF